MHFGFEIIEWIIKKWRNIIDEKIRIIKWKSILDLKIKYIINYLIIRKKWINNKIS